MVFLINSVGSPRMSWGSSILQVGLSDEAYVSLGSHHS
jgi:hypothetical protein